MRTILITLLFIISFYTKSQNANSVWYFGDKTGIDFNTNPPTVLSNSAIHAMEGCASIADGFGVLQFYTNSDTIWNKQHQVMANGTGLMGSKLVGQSSLIVKQPGSNPYYLVFSVNTTTNNSGLYYSTVDMSLAGGTGSVIAKNIQIKTGYCTQRITGIKHCNGHDYWIIIQTGINPETFETYLVTGAGVNPNPVLSVGSTYPLVSPFINGGKIKGSPNGKKIAVANTFLSSNSFEILDFNNNSGVLSNPVIFGYNLGLDVEFSPNGQVLYGIADQPSTLPILIQWNISVTNSVAIMASQFVVYLLHSGAMQLAPNGKLYIAEAGQQKMSVINNPDNLGIACNFSSQAQAIAPGFCTNGLPNMVSNLFTFSSPINITSNNNFSVCAGSPIILLGTGVFTYSWSNNIFTPSLVVTPTTTATYSVVGTFTDGCVYAKSATVTVQNCLDTKFDRSEVGGTVFYPNPTSNTLYIKTKSDLTSEAHRVQLFNALGQLVRNEELNFRNGEAGIDVADLPVGVYTIKLQFNTNRTIYKQILINR